MNIIYIITILAIYILIMLIQKSEKKQNLIAWLAISAILILCYNILICLISTLIGILCTLVNLSICNAITIILLMTIIIKNKKLQKYYVKISDVIYAILIFLLVTIIAYKQYGFPFNIKYRITDGSSHYFFAQQFYENSTLLYNEVVDDMLRVYNSDYRLPGAYVNEGIAFKIFDGIVLKTDIFILFDLFILYLSGILFYSLLKNYAKENKVLKILAMIFSVIYMLGYQLNSMLYGYVYLSFALCVIISFLLVFTKYEKKEISKIIVLPILSLISFGIFFSYAYFIPIIYISIIICIIVKSIKNKEKILSPQNIIEIMYLIIIPLILGVAYFVIFPLVSGIKTEISTIGVDGAIYENYITNHLIFIPILILSAIMSIKNKNIKIHYASILLVMAILFIIILFIGYKIEIVSKYYFFKAYYIIWLLAIYNLYIGLSYIVTQKNEIIKAIMCFYMGIYITGIIVGTQEYNNIGMNHIFYENLNIIAEKWSIVKNEEIKISDIIEKTIETNEMYILAPVDLGRAKWMSVLHHNQYIYIDYITSYEITIEKWLENKNEKYYLAYYEDYSKIKEKEEPEENSEQYKIIYNDEYAFILERK